MALISGIAILFVVMTHAPAQQGNSDSSESEIQRGFAAAPVPLNLIGKNRSLVGLGSYYVNGISDCTGCHTGATGHLGGGEVFGPVLSRNLTPDAHGNPAGLTFAQFKDVIRNGTDFKGIAPPGPLIIMPWPAYRHGTDRYIEALYEYLRAIPCLEGGPGVPSPRC